MNILNLYFLLVLIFFIGFDIVISKLKNFKKYYFNIFFIKKKLLKNTLHHRLYYYIFPPILHFILDDFSFC
jgi:hypothetical protein